MCARLKISNVRIILKLRLEKKMGPFLKFEKIPQFLQKVKQLKIILT